MANYEFTVTSKPIKTKNNEEFLKVFLDLGFEESSIENGSVYVGSYGEAYWDDNSLIVVRGTDTKKVIGAYNTYCGYDTLEDYLMANNLPTNLYEEIDIVEYIQSMLLEGQAFVLTEAGHEKLRYNNGWAIIITKDEVKSYDITCLVEDYLDEHNLNK